MGKVRIRLIHRGQRGFTLIEVVIAMLLLGMIGVAIFTSLSYASTVLIIADRQATAESIARSQMEFIKDDASNRYKSEDPQPYEHDYIESADNPGYFISVDAEPLHSPDDGIQLITVTVRYDIVRYNAQTQGSTLVSKTFTLEDYKRDPHPEE